MSNPPVEIESTMPTPEEEVPDGYDRFWDIVFMRAGGDIEETETYDDFDDARSDYLVMTQDERDDYKYAVLREVMVAHDGSDEDIHELTSYGI